MLKSTQRFSLALAVSALVFAGGHTTAQAEGASREVPQVVVRYNDISLTTEHGVQVLYKRLQAAARQVCSTYEGHNNLLSNRAKWQACYDQALAGAVTEVNVEQLTALYKKNVSKTSLS